MPALSLSEGQPAHDRGVELEPVSESVGISQVEELLELGHLLAVADAGEVRELLLRASLPRLCRSLPHILGRFAAGGRRDRLCAGLSPVAPR